MKYTNSIEIDLPREKVAQLLADPAHIQKWLRGVLSHEPVSGKHGELGTTSRVRDALWPAGDGGHRNDHTPRADRPAADSQGGHGSFDREIVGGGMWSVTRDRLTESDPTTTLWESDSEYRLSGLLMRLIGLLMPGAFHKQSQQHMKDFKAFAEHGKDVREGDQAQK